MTSKEEDGKIVIFFFFFFFWNMSSCRGCHTCPFREVELPTPSYILKPQTTLFLVYPFVHYLQDRQCIKPSSKSLYVTRSREMSHMSAKFWLFNITYLWIKNATFWSKPHYNGISGCKDIDNFLTFQTM